MSKRIDLPFNTGWKFSRAESIIGSDPNSGHVIPCFNDSAWDTVTLPHTARMEEHDVQHPWQGVCWYHREILADPSWTGKSVSVVFGAAMQIADIWVNGTHKSTHLGGYLPFAVDITSEIQIGVVIDVRLDNRDTNICPPGKPTSDLDFFYSGGLYRGARLVVTNPVHISDPITADIEAGGGIFVSYDHVSTELASVRVKTHIVNKGLDPARRCAVRSRIVDHKGAVAAVSSSEPVMIAQGGSHHLINLLDVQRPCLWHPDQPYLYTLETVVEQDGVIVDSLSTRIGIKKIELKNRLLLNGKELRLRGTNRHQEYPYIGYALSPNAQRRDAIKIKEAGLNFVRLSHYPQDPAFLAACDEIGLLVQAPIPGWQIFHSNNSFVETSFRNIRELIRRDRNHACLLFWEPNFNETDGDHTDWCRAAYEITHTEHPGDQCFAFGDDYPSGWSGWDVKGLVREYGDWVFGGNESTSRRRRYDGEEAMLQQAWNFQWTLNHLSRSFDDDNVCYLGAANWLMFDHNRGYYPKPNWCGMTDIFRLPKFVYYFYQSQRDPSIVRPHFDSGPMVYIASLWTQRKSPDKVVVYSNCDEVELFLNGRSISRQAPDSGPDTPYSNRSASTLATVGHDVDTSGGNPFDGGNAAHLEHPPFTFMDVSYQSGELKAIGYRDGDKATEFSVRTPEAPAELRIAMDLSGTDLHSDGADAAFLHAFVVDANGTVVPDASPNIEFTVHGPAHLIGGVHTNGGVASTLLQTETHPGEVTITATSPGLISARHAICIVAPESTL